MVYLYIWMVVAAHGNGFNSYTMVPSQMHHGWVNQGGYESRSACDNAAKVLEMKVHRCIPGGAR